MTVELVMGGGGGGGGGLRFSGAKAFRSAALSIPQNTVTNIGFDNELWDTNNYHDNVVNNTNFVIPFTSRYWIHGQIMDSAHAQDSYVQLRVMKNAAEALHGGRATYGGGPGGVVNVVNPFKTEVIGELSLIAGDVLTLEAFSANNGIAQNLILNVANNDFCIFELQRLG